MLCNWNPYQYGARVMNVAKKLAPARLPSVDEIVAAALAGACKRGWYAASTIALTDTYGHDAPRFAALLAALSPQCSVETNLTNARRTWDNWRASGRPLTRGAIIKVMGASVIGNNLTASLLPAWIPNAIRALMAEDPTARVLLSGPKVDAFRRNLQGDLSAVVLDAWMARYAGLDAVRLRGSLAKDGKRQLIGRTYQRYADRIVDAARALEWAPAEVQECVWAWTKTAYDIAARERHISTARELVRDGDITRAEMLKTSVSFADLLRGSRHGDSSMPYVESRAGQSEQLIPAALRLQIQVNAR